MNDFKFSIVEVTSLLNLKERNLTSKGRYFDCPFCRGKSKLHIDFFKNIYRCNKCNESGGMLKLFADYYGLNSLSEAKKNIESQLNGVSDNFRKQISAKKIEIENSKTVLSETKSVKEIDKVYRALLSMLTLSKSHETKLLERGLSKDVIKEKFLASMPMFGHRQLANSLIKQGHDLSGIPGFYIDENNNWTLNFQSDSPGILIPNININNEIFMLEKRLDTPYKGVRYFRVSSTNKNNGCKSLTDVNFSGDPNSNVIYLTEGCLKAIISNKLSNKTFASISGVSNYATLKPFFKTLKSRNRNREITIIETLDMDKLTNPNVSKMRDLILNLIKENGFNVKSLTWNPEFKGIDDYLFEVEKEKSKC